MTTEKRWILYDYFRSSAAYRVRIALNLKGIAYEPRSISLLKKAQSSAEYLSINPQGLVPTLTVNSGQHLTQSLAICEYLDEEFPDPPFMPKDALARARVRALAQSIACDLHPLNNLRVLGYLTGQLQLSDEAKLDWYRHWIASGLTAFENALDHPASGTFCHGDKPGLADLCLVPQWYNAKRFNCDINAYPKLTAIVERCEHLPAFAKAHPDQQPDAG